MCCEWVIFLYRLLLKKGLEAKVCAEVWLSWRRREKNDRAGVNNAPGGSGNEEYVNGDKGSYCCCCCGGDVCVSVCLRGKERGKREKRKEGKKETEFNGE